MFSGMATAVKLFSLFKPIFELLQPMGSKLAISMKLSLMHAPNSLDFNRQHECCYLCYQAFPKQRCGNICRFAPLLMCCLAATFPLIWKSILREQQPSLAILHGVSKLTNLSESSVLVRVEVMSWLTRRQARFSPAILDHNLLLECLAGNQESVVAGSDSFQGTTKSVNFT